MVVRQRPKPHHAAVVIAVAATVGGSEACRSIDASLDGLPCDAWEQCVDGYACHPLTLICVPEANADCIDPEAYCPSPGDRCDLPGSFVHCPANWCATDPCPNAVSTCDNGTWGSCHAGDRDDAGGNDDDSNECPTLGQVPTCSDCDNDCTRQIQNADPLCLATGGLFVCDYDGDCYFGTKDLDGYRDNGCECTISVEVCDGADNDCDNVIDEYASCEGGVCESGECVACTRTDPLHCGDACAVCGGSTPICNAGMCVCSVDSCPKERACREGVCEVIECGDDLAEGKEQCDGDDLRDATCGSLGYKKGGKLKCDDDCEYKTKDCRD